MKRIIIIGTEPLIIIEIPYYHIVTARPTGNRLQQAKKCAPSVSAPSLIPLALSSSWKAYSVS